MKLKHTNLYDRFQQNITENSYKFIGFFFKYFFPSKKSSTDRDFIVLLARPTTTDNHTPSPPISYNKITNYKMTTALIKHHRRVCVTKDVPVPFVHGWELVRANQIKRPPSVTSIRAEGNDIGWSSEVSHSAKCLQHPCVVGFFIWAEPETTYFHRKTTLRLVEGTKKKEVTLLCSGLSGRESQDKQA